MSAPGAIRIVEGADGARLQILVFPSRRHPPATRILLVPGFLSFIESWELVVRELTACCDVLYFESREKRSSALPPGARFRIEELTADLGSVARALDLAPRSFDVVASCGGAATVLHAHAEGVLRPRRMVWIAPGLRPRVPWIVVPLARVLRGPAYGLQQRLAVAWYRHVVDPPSRDGFQRSRFLDVVRRADPRKTTRAARDLYGLRVDPELARAVTVPVLVLAASQDRAHAFAESVDLADRLPAGRLIDVGLFWRTRSPAAGRTLRRFLADDGCPGAG